MTTLKIRVPLCEINGNMGYITLEWLKDLQAVLKEAAASGSSADLTSLKAQVAAIIVKQTDFETRIRKLEIGYQA